MVGKKDQNKSAISESDALKAMGTSSSPSKDPRESACSSVSRSFTSGGTTSDMNGESGHLAGSCHKRKQQVLNQNKMGTAPAIHSQPFCASRVQPVAGCDACQWLATCSTCKSCDVEWVSVLAIDMPLRHFTPPPAANPDRAQHPPNHLQVDPRVFLLGSLGDVL